MLAALAAVLLVTMLPYVLLFFYPASAGWATFKAFTLLTDTIAAWNPFANKLTGAIAQAVPEEYRNSIRRFCNDNKDELHSFTIIFCSLTDRPNEIKLNYFLSALWTQTSLADYLH